MNIEGLEFQEKIGGQAGREVWKARHVALDRTVALRILDRRTVGAPGRTEAVLKAVSASARLKHPNLVHVYNMGEQDGFAYLVMEFVDGGALEHLISAHGPLPQQDALKLAECVADVLELAWNEAKLAHGNLTPANIMLDASGAVKVADLGQTPPPGPAHDDAPRAPHFRAPELAGPDATPDTRSDMYSLGALLYFLLTGRRPFDGHAPKKVMALQAHGYLPDPRTLKPEISGLVSKLIGRLLAKDPTQRFATWGSARDNIKAAAAGRILISKSSSPASTIDRRNPQQRQPGRHPRRRATDSFSSGAVPLWFRAPAWLLLFAFWAFLLHKQYTQPVLTTIWQPPLPEPRAGMAPTRPGPVVVPRPAVARRPSAPPAPAEAAPPPRPEMSPSEREQLSRAARAAAAALLADDHAAAGQATDSVRPAQGSPAFQRAGGELSALVSQATRLDEHVAAALKQRTGVEVSLVFDDEPRRLVPQSVSGLDVSAQLIKGEGADRRVTDVVFSVAELPPAEKLRLLGSPETELQCAMHVLLHVKAGDRQAAKALAARCGPLAQAFGEQLRD